MSILIGSLILSQTVKETGDIVLLNKEIRNLNDEIQSKRFELIEEEEVIL